MPSLKEEIIRSRSILLSDSITRQAQEMNRTKKKGKKFVSFGVDILKDVKNIGMIHKGHKTKQNREKIVIYYVSM